ncbi:MAG: hypothetical protein Q7R39_01315 [Dehalococcoidia bacterium]|nr:hypothetical protein [Dehalococcoidia bacterium]
MALITLPQYALQLGTNPKTGKPYSYTLVRKWFKQGRLAATKIGRDYMVEASTPRPVPGSPSPNGRAWDKYKHVKVDGEWKYVPRIGPGAAPTTVAAAVLKALKPVKKVDGGVKPKARKVPVDKVGLAPGFEKRRTKKP